MNEVAGVRGLETPRIQWMVIALCIVLTILLVTATVRMRTLQDLLRRADAVMSTNEKGRETLERDLARERAAREALALELARARSGPAPLAGGAVAGRPPTLTLEPLLERSGSPPDPSLDAPSPDALVELRLLLPEKAPHRSTQLQISARDWTTGAVRWTLGRLRLAPADGRRAAVAYVSGEMLAPGVYEIVLTHSGEGGPQPDTVAAYALGISRRAAR